jgi:hypothetical protein
MSKIMKCSVCGHHIPYDSKYENRDFKFLLDKEKIFVAQIKDDEVICVDCIDK